MRETESEREREKGRERERERGKRGVPGQMTVQVRRAVCASVCVCAG